jgi:hypothetical protein
MRGAGARVAVTLGTGSSASAFAGGLTWNDVRGLTRVVGTYAWTELVCADPPPNALVIERGHLSAGSVPLAERPQDDQYTGFDGADLLARFHKTIGGDFGDRTVRLSDTIGPVGTINSYLHAVLRFTRCPHRAGRTPRGC